MSRLVLALTLAVLSAAAGQTMQIATRNLGGFPAIPEGRPENILEASRLLDADIVVLPDFNPLGHVQTIAEILSATPGACYDFAALDQPRAARVRLRLQRSRDRLRCRHARR